jgi:hypothetical protein
MDTSCTFGTTNEMTMGMMCPYPNPLAKPSRTPGWSTPNGHVAERSWGLVVHIRLADGRATKVTGLLGNFDSDPGNVHPPGVTPSTPTGPAGG